MDTGGRVTLGLLVVDGVLGGAVVGGVGPCSSSLLSSLISSPPPVDSFRVRFFPLVVVGDEVLLTLLFVGGEMVLEGDVIGDSELVV